MAQVGAQYVQAVQPVPVGSLQAYAGASAPTGWLLCDGTSYSTSVYPELFSVLGYTYGGSSGTFYVPDLRGRVPLGAGTGAQQGGSGSGVISGGTALTARTRGAFGGDERLQSHTHNVIEVGQNLGTLYSSGGSPLLGWNATYPTPAQNQVSGDHSRSGKGSGENMPPFLVTNYIIKAYPDVPRSGIALGNTPPIVTALPVNPQFGEVVTYAADATNGIYWNLQYDASGTYPWKFIGGSAFACSPVTATQTTTSTSYTDLSTVGPSFTTSLPGDYSFEMQCLMENGTTGSYASVTLSNNGSSVGTEFYVRMASASITTPASWTTTTTMTTVGHVAKMMYRSITSGTSAFGNRAMYVTPIRVKAA